MIDAEYYRIMQKKYSFMLVLAMMLAANTAFSQSATSDSVDVLNYDLQINFTPDSNCKVQGLANIRFVRTKPCTQVTFDLICDSVGLSWLDAQSVACQYERNEVRLTVPMPQFSVPDTHELQVRYYTNGYVESYGFGGLHVSQGICYNLGAAFSDYPHCYGRSFYPCRDNFYDKATYTYTITSPSRYLHQCGGIKQSDVLNDDDTRTTVWTLNHPIPTYLSSVSMAKFHVIEREYQGLYGTYPATLSYTNHDSASVYEAYDILEDVIPMYERRFGPYRWGRVGYIATEKGSMEHTNNIALVSVCMADKGQPACQMTICHELAHSWFGNLITCATQEDMWFNEGGASFCEEVATEAAFGKRAADKYYQEMLSEVLRTAHVVDNGYRSLSGMSQYYTYGTTTYKQGAMMWHSLRGYMGDSLFYACMQRLFSNMAFGNVNAEQLRDSLSLYSGMNLNDFFDFHVLNPGFVDYGLERMEANGNQATITLRQRLVATDRYSRSNRVPVTFFSAEHQAFDCMMEFDDSVATQTFDLPFTASYAVVDLHHQLSDACTSDTTLLRAKGLREMPNSHCKISVPKDGSMQNAWLHVGHHYVQPGGQVADGIVRLSNRYWQVTGQIDWDNIAQGRFLYNQGANNSTKASYIDEGFYDKRATLDSLALVYRADPSQPWQLVSRKRTSSSGVSSGYFVTNLFPGQYALAVVDTSVVTVSAVTPQNQLRVMPNPASGNQFKVDWGGTDEKMTLTMYDSMSRKVLEKRDVTSGSTITHQLHPGTYFILIQNNYVSLHSQIIIQ